MLFHAMGFARPLPDAGGTLGRWIASRRVVQPEWRVADASKSLSVAFGLPAEAPAVEGVGSGAGASKPS